MFTNGTTAVRGGEKSPDWDQRLHPADMSLSITSVDTKSGRTAPTCRQLHPRPSNVFVTE